MGVNLSIKDVPEALAQSLRERAARNHRSLQGELMSIIEQAARAAPMAPTVPVQVPDGDVEPVGKPSQALPSPSGSGVRVQGWLTPEQVWQDLQASDWFHDPVLRRVPRAVDIVRADRDSR